MAAGGGMMYTASFANVNVPNLAAVSLWEIAANPGTSCLIHSIRIEFVPAILQGFARDERADLVLSQLSSLGGGGTAIAPAAEHPRNIVAAVTTFNSVVKTRGVAINTKSASRPSTVVFYERLYTPDQRIPIPAGTRLGIAIAVPMLRAYQVSSEIYFEEF